MAEYASYIVQTWQESNNQPMCWRVCSVHDEKEMRFPNASFLVRVWVDDQAQVVRCLVRHVQDGREVQFQSGERVIEFIRAWLMAEQAGAVEVLSDECAL